MKLLLDTHIALWSIYNDKNLTEKARKLIQNPDNIIFYSVVTTWEIYLKQVRHPDDPYYDINLFLDGCGSQKFVPLRLEDKHVRTVKTISLSENAPVHKDPFDRMLLAQSKAENILFLTHDNKFVWYNEPYVICV